MKKMMMVLAAVVVVAPGMVMTLSAAEKAPQKLNVTIGEYKTGFYDVEGAVKAQLDAAIGQIDKLAGTGNGKLQISVEGSADGTGKDLRNQDLALQRAQQAVGYLKRFFPLAEFPEPISAGSSYGKRVVIIHVTRLPVAGASYSHWSDRRFIAIFTVIVVLLSALSTVFAVKIRKSKSSPAEISTVLFSWNKKVWEKQVVLREGGYDVGLTSRTGRPVIRESLSDAAAALRGAGKDPEFHQQLLEMAERGEIREATAAQRAKSPKVAKIA